MKTTNTPMQFRRYDWKAEQNGFVGYGHNEGTAVADCLWAMGANGNEIARELNKMGFSAALIARLTGAAK